PAAQHRRVDHRVTGPGGRREVLGEVAVAAAVQHERGALRHEPVLVQVRRHRGDARDPEVPRRQVVRPPGQHQTADARVDVEVDAARGAARGDVLDRVDGAARVAGCADDGEGDPAARGRDVVERGEQVGGVHRTGARVDRHLDEVEAQVGGRLAEGRVRRGGQHQGETCVTAGGARTVAGRLDG